MGEGHARNVQSYYLHEESKWRLNCSQCLPLEEQESQIKLTQVISLLVFKTSVRSS